MKSRLLLAVALSVAADSAVGAQQPAAKPAAAPPAAVKPQDLPVIEPGYAYDPQGRRDPFISLLGRGDESKPQAARPTGLAGVLIGEVSVKGVLRDRGGYTAMLQGPDKKTHTVRVGDKLLDGSVKAITHEQVVFSQDVNDPLSLVKQREVAKPVRPAEGRG
jgi:type IV pilus assembly protein PilP